MSVDVYSNILTGIENEYALVTRPGEDVEAFCNGVIRRSADDFVSTFGSNGSRLYLDVGQHLETATPECLDEDATSSTVYDRASEQLLIQYLQKQASDHPRPGKVTLVKNNSDGTQDWGNHENYLLKRRTNLVESIIEHMVAYFVTRQLFAGAGQVEGHGSGWSYRISQRSASFETVSSLQTVKQRPIINLRDEPHANSSDWYRFHYIGGEANILYWPAGYKVRLTGLLLCMLEQRKLSGITLVNPVKAIKDVSRNIATPIPIRRNGTIERVSARDIQLHYWRQADAFEHQHPSPLHRRAIDWWGWVLGQLGQTNLTPLVGHVDWVTKQYSIDGHEARLGVPLSYERARAIDLAYHTLTGSSALAEKIRLRYDPPGLDAHVRAAMTTPPETRARLRGNLVEHVLRAQAHNFSSLVDGRQHQLPGITLVAINWGLAKLTVGDDTYVVNLDNPLQTISPSYHAAVQALGERTT